MPLKNELEVTCEWLVDCLLCKREGGVLCTKYPDINTWQVWLWQECIQHVYKHLIDHLLDWTGFKGASYPGQHSIHCGLGMIIWQMWVDCYPRDEFFASNCPHVSFSQVCLFMYISHPIVLISRMIIHKMPLKNEFWSYLWMVGRLFAKGSEWNQ